MLPKVLLMVYKGEELLFPATNTSTNVRGQHATEAGGLFLLLALVNRSVLLLCCMVLPTAVTAAAVTVRASSVYA